MIALAAPATRQVKMTEVEHKYYASLQFVREASASFDRLTPCPKHYRTRGGRLLISLDEVVAAILKDELAEPVA